MAEKQTDADKAAAMTEYRQQHNAAVDRIAALRAARLARDASAPPPAPKVKAVAKTGAKATAKDRCRQTGHQNRGKIRRQVPAKAAARIGTQAADAPKPILSGEAPQLEPFVPFDHPRPAHDLMRFHANRSPLSRE